MKRWLYWAAGGLAILAFWILGGPERKVAKIVTQRDDLLRDGSEKAKAQATKLNMKADKHQANALEAGLVGKATVDDIGKNGETVSGILDSWRSDSV